MCLALEGLWRRVMRWKRHLTANRKIWLGLGERASLITSVVFRPLDRLEGKR